MDKRYISDKIVKWYEENKRSLPWRETKDPYKVWLSEIILQQTRVAQGLPYYLRFIEKYPSVNHLAAAPEEEVLRLWQGLGYYTRARNLHKCAQTIAYSYHGIFPDSFQGLLALQGVGEYTAAAIASISFRENVAVVDGNVFRVLARLFAIDTPINSPEGKKIFSERANELIKGVGSPDVYNQAIMEFGALWCTPKNPKCEACPLKKNCRAFQLNIQDRLPVKLRVGKIKKRYFNYIVIEQRGKLIMRKRESKDIWLGLFDFPLVESKKPVRAQKLADEQGLRQWLSAGCDIIVSETYKHVLTHQTIFSKFLIVKTKKTVVRIQGNSKVYSMKEIMELPKPVLVSRFLSDHYLL
jgi:A/G-specific adenine glycosylase